MKSILKALLVLGLLAVVLFFVQSYFERKVETKATKRNSDEVLDEVLLERFPNYETNSIVREQAQSELKRKTDSLLEEEFFDDIPLSIKSMSNPEKFDAAIVHFFTDNIDLSVENPKLLSNRLNFEIIGLVDKKLVKTLQDNKKYKVFGHKFSRIDNVTFNVLRENQVVEELVYGVDSKIEYSILLSTYTFNIGVFMCSVDSIKAVK
jgi:hypothetical protein